MDLIYVIGLSAVGLSVILHQNAQLDGQMTMWHQFRHASSKFNVSTTLSCRWIHRTLLVIALSCASPSARAGFLEWFFPADSERTVAVATTVTANLADPITRNIIRQKFTRLSHGSRLLIMDRIDSNTGKQLALSVTNGVWIYVEPGEYRVVESDQDETAGDRQIIVRNEITVPLREGGMQIVLPEGAVLPLDASNQATGPFIVRIDSSIFEELRPDRAYTVPIQRSEAATIDQSLDTEEDVDFFTRGFNDFIYGKFKGCEAEELSEVRYKGTLHGKLEAAAVYGNLGISAEVVQQSVATTRLNKGEIVTIRYYTRSGTGGEYIWKEFENCDEINPGTFRYIIRVPGPKEILISEEIQSNRGIPIDPASKRPFISCNDQYQKLFDYMSEKMEPQDIPFFIGLVARWRNHGDMETCTLP